MTLGPRQIEPKPVVAAPNHLWRSTKTYNHNIGLSCCFRQWRAKSHCRFMHGYSLKVHVEFSATNLDQNNWAVDFGGLKPLKQYLEEKFDHKTLVAWDDPQISMFREMAIAEMIQISYVDSTGMEAFAKMIFDHVQEHVLPNFPHATLNKVSVHEHDGNGAEYGRALASSHLWHQSGDTVVQGTGGPL